MNEEWMQYMAAQARLQTSHAERTRAYAGVLVVFVVGLIILMLLGLVFLIVLP